MSRGLSYQQIFTLRYIAACRGKCDCLTRMYEVWGQHVYTDDDHENGIKAGDLNENFASASFALSIRGLERRGLIKRDTSPRDRRRTCLTLTEQGEQKAAEYSKIHFGDDVDRRLAETAAAPIGWRESRRMKKVRVDEKKERGENVNGERCGPVPISREQAQIRHEQPTGSF